MFIAFIVGFCVWFFFCYAVLCVLSSFAIVLMGKREKKTLLKLSSRCLMTVSVMFSSSWCCESVLDVMRQSACLVVNQITVSSYGFLFNCTTVGQASNLTTALT